MQIIYFRRGISNITFSLQQQDTNAVEVQQDRAILRAE